ncbi:restriction endonuclease subunit M [Sulfodiicoccus acidiphilus]|uniref:site-specific DNA-methyltransferase (adenine-specific) n=1 Tax=Sulfodiicoccus acidiphilus TaxID=1670455 RepID=A0A348B5S0_9CREN|nr:N-6 DNA methylase [Sulfodiicoccus acidiphilus]BBD73522.1 restriction endonuclease subunit M [Sulfodiicoccus acidiphilus]GGT92556.1 restriction endonuclease subunit M [Sulfodiicoccus acidiphilus]
MGSERTLLEEFSEVTLRYLREADLRHRKSLGQFFTPRHLREEVLSHIPRLTRPRVLDPACGTGEFLASAREHFVDPELHCWEVDSKLAQLARELVPEARVEVVDSLSRPFREEFDVVLGNPPYFQVPRAPLDPRYAGVTSGRPNVYALFIYLGLRLLRRDGYLGFVVSSSMNNGAYFSGLRRYLVENSEVVYLRTLPDSKAFVDANHTFQVLVLRKGSPSTERYVFRKGGRVILTERAEELRKAWEGASSLREAGYSVRTGKVVWNQVRDRLTDDPSKGVLLVWATNIGEGELRLHNTSRPQYVRWGEPDKGPAIVVNRVVGHPSRPRLRAAVIEGEFVAENHVNVVYPPSGTSMEELKELAGQLNDPDTAKYVSMVTGNTQVSARELEELVPVRLKRRGATLESFLS